MKLLGIIIVGFDVKDQLVMRFFAFIRHWRKMGRTMRQYISEILLPVVHKLVNSVWDKEELPDQWKESIIVQFTKRVIKLTVIIIVGYHCYQLHTKFYRISSSQG
jgi:hypothetical protein